MSSQKENRTEAVFEGITVENVQELYERYKHKF